MTVTKQQVREFVQWASTREKSEENDSKLKYALDKMLVRVRPVLLTINEAWEDIDLNFANTDDKGVLIKDAQGYTYTKDAEKERIRQRRAVMKETVEIKPFFVDHSKFEVSAIDVAFGTGFVFDLKENEDETTDDAKTTMRLDAKT